MQERLTLWTATDPDGDECVLDRTKTPELWQFGVTKGSFRGYPVVDINRTQLQELHKAIGEELGI